MVRIELPERYIYRGRFYGAGTEDVRTEVAAALQRRGATVLSEEGTGSEQSDPDPMPGRNFNSRMSKAELVDIARSQGLDVRDSDTKAEVYGRLIERRPV